jgi:EAL domain-containing protein (putative c-di-GMP-specific phosphodiesterase class I)
MLRKVGADKAQGYYLSKPLALEDALAACRCARAALARTG